MTWKTNQHTSSRTLMRELKGSNCNQPETNIKKLKPMLQSLKSKKDVEKDPYKQCNLCLEWQEAQLNERGKNHSTNAITQMDQGSWMQSNKEWSWLWNKRPKLLQEAQHAKALENPKATMLTWHRQTIEGRRLFTITNNPKALNAYLK